MGPGAHRPWGGIALVAGGIGPGGLNRLPLLLFGLGIVLVVDWQGLLLYNRVARVALIRKKVRTTILMCLGRQK